MTALVERLIQENQEKEEKEITLVISCPFPGCEWTIEQSVPGRRESLRVMGNILEKRLDAHKKEAHAEGADIDTFPENTSL